MFGLVAKSGQGIGLLIRQSGIQISPSPFVYSVVGST